MNKIWKIIAHEYSRHVLRKRFIFALLSVPLWIVLSVGIGFLSVILTINNDPVGYVDGAHLFAESQQQMSHPSEFPKITYIRYADEQSARNALEQEQIQAIFIIPSDYLETRQSRLVYLEKPDDEVTDQFEAFLQKALLAEQTPQIATRITNGAEPVIHATQENRDMANHEWYKILAPIAVGIFLTVSVFTSGGYLMQAVVDEKENRTMEIIATSLSPMQIMGGKIIALILVGLTQVTIWSLFPLIVIFVAGPYVPFLKDFLIDWKLLVLAAITALPTFVLISALMATIGATITESSEGQQVSALVTLPAMAPFMLMSAILANPGGIIAVGLSLFPLTAALTLLLRMAFASVPLWQTILSVTLLIVSAVGALWLSGRVFRIGMLRYGKKMGLKDIMAAITSRPDSTQKEAPVHE